MQLPVNVPGRAVKHDLDTQVPASPVDGIPGSWILPGPAQPAQAIVTIWWITQQVEGFLYFSVFPLSNSALKKKWIFQKQQK